VRAATAYCGSASDASFESLCRVLELFCTRYANCSEIVLNELMRGLRSEREEALATVNMQLLQRLLQLRDDMLPMRCELALDRPHGIIGFVLAFISSPNATAAPAEGHTMGAGGGAALSEAARCYACIRLLLEVNASSEEAAKWLDGALSAEEVEAMVRWLKEASRTAALGRAVERARFLGVARRRPVSAFERTESQQLTLESLRGIHRRKART